MILGQHIGSSTIDPTAEQQQQHHQHQQQDVLSFCQRLPKVELHAHLNGCVRGSTIRELVHSQKHEGVTNAEIDRITATGHRSLADCFKLFDAVHQITTTHEAVTRITREVIEDFAADNVIYLELRTTPKSRPEHGITKRSYMSAVLAGLDAFRAANPGADIIVKFLLSIDRRNDTAAAQDTVDLAIELMSSGVMGVDLSGNPSVGSWATWLPALQRARQAGLLVTLHAAEVLNTAETHAMLDFRPERLCHMCVLDEELQKRLWASNIPVELCLTSNVKAKHTAMANQVTWQLVQLAERVIEYRAATAGQQVPRRDWRAWLALFAAGDPSLGTPVISQGPVSKEAAQTSRIMNTAELQDYLTGQGEWTSPAEAATPAAPSSRPGTASTARPATADPNSKAVAQQTPGLGRLVAELAALAQRLQGHPAIAMPAAAQGDAQALGTTAAAAAALPVDTAAQTVQSIPLKIAVAGGPFSGKSTVASALADKFGLKLIVPEQLVTDAVAAAQAWEQQQQQPQLEQQQPPGQHSAGAEQQEQDLVAPAAVPVGPEPSKQVLLGQKMLQLLQQGAAVSDEMLLDLLLLAMVDAKDYTAPPPEAPSADAKSTKGGKATGKAEVPAALKAGAAALDAAGTPAAPLPAHLTAGAAGRGFVMDGFPATAAQAMLLEKALKGLDTVAEQALVEQASLVAPPPLDALPQLQRPLRSGLDAVILLGCDDETLAVKRALGRRLDPVTGRIYHLDFDPPPSKTPGLSERLVAVSGPDNDATQVPQRLASYATATGPLSAWLSRFSTLQRPLDGSVSLHEVLTGASDIVSGILVAKGAAHAAQTAAEAAGRARESAEKARDSARAAQGHAEGAARELLAAKRAEIQAAALLNGGKNPDPASTEVLKAQAAAKCAEQLKVCRMAAADASHHAERADAASQQAAAAVQRCKLAVGDAAVSAEAEAAANKAAVDSEAAASAAADAAKKAEAAKRLSEAYVAEAEKWIAAADVPADAAVPSVQQLSAATGDVGDSSDAASAAGPGGSQLSSSTSTTSKALLGPAGLPAALVPVLHDEWQLLERTYVDGMSRGFSGLRGARNLALNHVAKNCSWFSSFLKRPDNKQQTLRSFVDRFNAVEPDMRKAKETQGELLLRTEELRDALWAICDAKNEEAEAARTKLANDGSAAEHVALLGQHMTSLVQVELDRFLSTCQFLYSYCHYTQGIYHPLGADKPLCPLPTSLTSAAADPGKPEAAVKGAPPPPQFILSLQQKLPQLAAALKAAGAAAVATQSAALGLVEEASKRSAAAAANAATTANAAAAAAAAAVAGTAGAKGGKIVSATAAPAGGKAGGATTAASKLVASSEEAQAAAAAAAAAVAALPNPAALAVVSASLQTALAHELHLLQQRVVLFGSKAAVIIDEVVQLQATGNSQLAEWQQKRYVAECGAVAALEKVVKTAAAAGQPLPFDLRLEDEFFILDETRLLIPPAPAAPPQRPPSPRLPPGILSVPQLQQLASTLQQAAPSGFLALADAVDLMLKMASQGMLPNSWQDIDASHMTAALASLDPTYSGYLDIRELLLSLAAASIPSIHTATAAQVAAQATQLAAVDGDKDGYVTRQEFESVIWWFEPKPEAVHAAEETVAAAGPTAAESTVQITVAGQTASAYDILSSDQWAADVLREAQKCKAFKALLYDIFKQTLNVPVKKAAHSPPPPIPIPTAATAAVAVPATPKGGKGSHSASNKQSSSTTSPQSAAQSEAGSLAAAAVASSAVCGDNSVEAGPATEVCCSSAVLLYLCSDRDLYLGISKAVAGVAACAAPGAAVDAAAVVRMCYPLLTVEQAMPIQRAPLTPAQITAAVAAATAADTAATAAAPAPAPPASGGHGATASHSGGGQAAAAAAAACSAAGQGLSGSGIKASQLMYSAPCERIVTLMLQRYQWKDLFIAAKM